MARSCSMTGRGARFALGVAAGGAVGGALWAIYVAATYERTFPMDRWLSPALAVVPPLLGGWVALKQCD